MTLPEPLLVVEDVTKRFGATIALDSVSVAFLPGEVHALMGENGAGKSTLGKVISGLHRQDSGSVTLAGRRLHPGSIDDAHRAGVRIVHQELAQCPSLSVAENLCLHDPPRRALGLLDHAAARARAAQLLAPLDDSIDPRAPLGVLPPGQRQIVQIASALAAPQGLPPPRVIVFDEPTSSLSVAEGDRLLDIVRRLARDGLAVIYVSHRMGEIFACADRISVLRDGRLVATTPRGELDEPTLVQQMIGRRIDPADAPRPRPADLSPRLQASNIRSPDRLHGVSLSIRPGEILGVGGLVGAGRSELLDALFGLDPHSRGEIQIDSEPLPLHAPATSIRAGIGYVPEDRKLQGLCFGLDLAENMALPRLSALTRWGVRSASRERALYRERRDALAIKAPFPRASPAALSGGNQQKVLLARWMARDTRVLLLDEPTRGIDVGTKTEIHRLIRDAASRGAAVLLVSSEMPELLALSHRIIVLCDGRLAGELQGDDMTQHQILRLATLYHGSV